MRMQKDSMNGALAPIGRRLSKKDTKALLACADSRDSLYVSPLSAIECPVLLTGSAEDLMCRSDMEEEYMEMKEMMGNASIHMFKHGGHPAILSNAEEFAEISKDFIKRHVPLQMMP